MNKSSHEVWVYIEQKHDNIADVSFELLSKGRKLAEKLDGTLKAVIIGDNLEALAKQTFRYGAEEAIVVEHTDLKEYKTMPYSRILSELVKEHQPRIVLFGATFVGRDIAPRVASNTLSGLTADCTELQISDVTYMKKEYPKLLLQIRPAFGGKVQANRRRSAWQRARPPARQAVSTYSCSSLLQRRSAHCPCSVSPYSPAPPERCHPPLHHREGR